MVTQYFAESTKKYGRKIGQGFIAHKLQTQTAVEQAPKQQPARVQLF